MRLSSSLINVVVATLVAAKAANSFVLPSISSLSTTPRAPSTSTITGTSTTTTSTSIILKSESNDTNQNQDKNEDESSSFSSSEAAWDATVDYDKEWPDDQAPPDPSSAWDALPNLPQVQAAASKLGIDISLEPLSPAEAEELREQAKEIISSNIDQGIEDIEKMRKRMNKDLEQNARVMQVASELRADEKSRELMSKIDKLTEGFLESTKDSRTSTKRAAAASKAMEGRDAGIEMGTWGTLGGRAVVAGTSTTSGTGTLLGSVENAKRQSERMEGGEEDGATTTKDATEVAGRTENRIVVIADIQQDPLAKQLIPTLLEQFAKTDIPGLQVDVLSPTSTMPLGANNAACVVTVCSSVSQASSLNSMLDRLLRKTLGTNGQLGQPPTQLVGISTAGTERTNKFPYSLQNMLGKLDQRRQVEEVLRTAVKRRISEPPLDFTLIKVGEFKGSAKEFDLRPGDVLDDATTVETAAQTIVQAVAYQPFARNATLCVAGALPADMKEDEDNLFWDTAFLILEGPEVWRSEDVGDASVYDQLLEYVQGWAGMLSESGKGLTTPVRADNGIRSRSSHLVQQQDGVELLFLSTKTGRNYMSKEEERQREQATDKQASGISGNFRKRVKEGGIDVVVEITKENKLRVRARRCNYAEDAIIKELSEETILKRLEDAITVWKKEHL